MIHKNTQKYTTPEKKKRKTKITPPSEYLYIHVLPKYTLYT